jgi:hypothetical protein
MMTDDDWVRMPKPKERLKGLSRTTLLELIEAGHVKSIVIRKGQSRKGIRLIFLPSLLSHFESLSNSPE